MFHLVIILFTHRIKSDGNMIVKRVITKGKGKEGVRSKWFINGKDSNKDTVSTVNLKVKAQPSKPDCLNYNFCNSEIVQSSHSRMCDCTHSPPYTCERELDLPLSGRNNMCKSLFLDRIIKELNYMPCTP